MDRLQVVEALNASLVYLAPPAALIKMPLSTIEVRDALCHIIARGYMAWVDPTEIPDHLYGHASVFPVPMDPQTRGRMRYRIWQVFAGQGDGQEIAASSREYAHALQLAGIMVTRFWLRL